MCATMNARGTQNHEILGLIEPARELMELRNVTRVYVADTGSDDEGGGLMLFTSDNLPVGAVVVAAIDANGRVTQYRCVS